MKILTNKQIDAIDLYTSRLHSIARKIETSDDERDVLLGNIDLIRTACKLPYIRRFEHFIQMPEVKPPKEKECSHDFEIAYSPHATPFLFCRHCAEVKRIVLNEEQAKQEGGTCEQ